MESDVVDAPPRAINHLSLGKIVPTRTRCYSRRDDFSKRQIWHALQFAEWLIWPLNSRGVPNCNRRDHFHVFRTIKLVFPSQTIFIKDEWSTQINERSSNYPIGENLCSLIIAYIKSEIGCPRQSLSPASFRKVSRGFADFYNWNQTLLHSLVLKVAVKRDMLAEYLNSLHNM